MTITDPNTDSGSSTNVDLVREVIVDLGGVSFSDAAGAITWLEDPTNVDFLFGARADLAPKLLNQLKSETRRDHGLKELNKLYLAQLVWRGSDGLHIPNNLRKRIVGELRSDSDKVRDDAMAEALEVITKAESELPLKAAAIDVITALTQDTYLMSNLSLFEWQEVIIGRTQAGFGLNCTLGGLQATAKHLQNCETRLYGYSETQQTPSSGKPKVNTKAKAKARGIAEAAKRAEAPERKRGYVKEGMPGK